MLAWLRAMLAQRRDKKRLDKEINPESFRHLSLELRELASLAERLLPRDHEFYIKLKRIQSEMRQLEDLAAKPEFRRLSPEKRLELKKSLIQSRDQLMETVQTAPSPTDTLQ